MTDSAKGGLTLPDHTRWRVADTPLRSERNDRSSHLAQKPPSPHRPIQVDVTDADIAALTSLLRRGGRAGNENDEAQSHLQELIPKPWGEEYRVYVDDFLDVWHLQISPGQATSIHAHPRKMTYLLWLSGTGVTHTLSGAIEVREGTVLHIRRGAFHSTQNVSAVEPLRIIEVETPRNKYDLLRLRDGYDRAGTGYEQIGRRLADAPRRVSFLPNAWMRRASLDSDLAFDIVSGMDVHYRRRSAGTYLVPLGIAEILSDRMAILSDHPDDTRSPNLDCYYLGIRQVGLINHATNAAQGES